MKKTLTLLFLVVLFAACRRSPIPQLYEEESNIRLIDSKGNNLLDPKFIGHLTQDSIQVYDVDDRGVTIIIDSTLYHINGGDYVPDNTNSLFVTYPHGSLDKKKSIIHWGTLQVDTLNVTYVYITPKNGTTGWYKDKTYVNGELVQWLENDGLKPSSTIDIKLR